MIEFLKKSKLREVRNQRKVKRVRSGGNNQAPEGRA